MAVRQPVTLTQVAEAAGVSIATVSRVLNRRGQVDEHTRRRVMTSVENLGYDASSIARKREARIEPAHVQCRTSALPAGRTEEHAAPRLHGGSAARRAELFQPARQCADEYLHMGAGRDHAPRGKRDDFQPPGQCGRRAGDRQSGQRNHRPAGGGRRHAGADFDRPAGYPAELGLLRRFRRRRDGGPASGGVRFPEDRISLRLRQSPFVPAPPQRRDGPDDRFARDSRTSRAAPRKPPTTARSRSVSANGSNRGTVRRRSSLRTRARRRWSAGS